MAAVAALLFPRTGLVAQAGAGHFRQISIEDGLSESVVSCIQQDSTGFLWVGTEAGLNRYDGHGFRVFHPASDDSTTISDDFISTLYYSKAGQLWVGTWSSGLNLYRPESESFIRYKHDDADSASISGNQILAIHEDQRGRMLVGTRDNGLSILDVAAGRFSHLRHDPDSPSITTDHIQAIAVDDSGIVWIGTTEGIDLWDPGANTFRHYEHERGNPRSLADNLIHHIIPDSVSGAMWIATEAGLSRTTNPERGFQNFRFDRGIPHNVGEEAVFGLFVDPGGSVWAGTNGLGLRRIDPQSDRVISYRHDPRVAGSLGDDRIRSVFQDRGGVLWVGTWGSGLSKLDRTTEAFRLFRSVRDSATSLADRGVFALYEDSRSAIWVGTYGAGVDQLDMRTGEFRHYPPMPASGNGLSDGDVRAILEDTRGSLWVGTFGGLNLLDRTTGRFTPYFNPDTTLPRDPDRIFTLYEDRDSTLWVGTYGAGLAILDRDTREYTNFINNPDDPTTLSQNDVRVIHEDRAGRFWVGTWSGGLNLMDRQQSTFTQIRHDPSDSTSLSNDAVYDIHEDDDGTLWVATRGGLNRFDPSQTPYVFEHPAADALGGEVIYGILPDREFLWLSTNVGLFRFDKRDESILSFRKEDGLQSDEFNGGAFGRTAGGLLMFGGVGGFNVFNPDSVIVPPLEPPVVITSITHFTGDSTVPLRTDRDGVLRLGPNDDIVSFEFSVLDFASPERNTYSYQLQGLRDEWVELGARNEITFVDLPHGDYVFRVRGKNYLGRGSETGLEVRLAIAPPLWATTWFRALVVLVLGALAVGAHRYRTAAIQRRAKELGREVAERRRAESALRESEELFRSLIDHAPEAIVTVDAATGRFVDWNENALALYGLGPDEMGSKGPIDVSPEMQPTGERSADGVARMIRECAAGQTPEFEWLHTNSDGDAVPCEVKLVKVVHAGKSLIRASVTDISERYRAREERKKLAAQLQQSQKMEVVGQLTGGVAHDFNNLLTVVIGNLELLAEELEDERARMNAESALNAAQRGAALTQRLLAFSRKQALRPTAIDVADLLFGMDGLLRRSLGETIEVRIVAPPGLWHCEADRVQLENAVLNLAINARDAMPGGGKLTVEAINTTVDEPGGSDDELSPGEYVVVAVSDTGTGMDETVSRRAFDPFFTTKEVGGGSGLGLSMVYGFAIQSGGAARIYTEPGEGTTVRVYLPRTTANAESIAAASTDFETGNGETILVVEDDPAVRELTVSMLRHAGYVAAQAADATQGIEMLEKDGWEPDLILTDVVLPGGVSGVQMAEQVKQLHPGIKILFMSGYTENAIIHHGRLDAGVRLLEKPFTRSELTAKVLAAIHET